jgi:adenylate cyclase
MTGSDLDNDERRLEAIMFTDIVGYTALAQTSEALALEILEKHNRALRPIFLKHRGKEVKTIGDSFLVEFDSTLDATLCAIEIQTSLHDNIIPRGESVEKIRLRIGVHLGDVIHKGSDIFGDAVNIASRIQPLANPEGICISEQVFDQIYNKIRYKFREIKNPSLKNVNFQTRVYSIEMPWEENTVSRDLDELDMRRLAVLPFSSISPDPNDEYFADGMTEELTSTLSKLPELSVISRTSVMQYKSERKEVSEISKRLNVGTLLEGSVRKAGNRVRISVQLIDANEDKHMWTETYDRSFEDVFEIQSDIAQRVASALRIELLEKDRKKIRRSPTRDPEAHDLYLKGLFHMDRITAEGYLTALEYFEKAKKRDPEFALAYAEIALAYNFLGFFEIMPSKEAFAKSRQAVTRALELDESLAEAHQAMTFLLDNEWDFEGELKELQRVLEINPSVVGARYQLANHYLNSWQTERALQETEKALEFDPVSPTSMQYAATSFLYCGYPDRAMELYKKVLELDPNSSQSVGNLGLCYVKKGMFDKGVAEIKRNIEMSNVFFPPRQSDLVYALVKAGRTGEANEVIQKMLLYYEEHHIGSTAIACAYASIGDKDKAFEWLDIAYNEHAGYLQSAPTDFSFENMHSDPRFIAFLKKMKIVPVSNIPNPPTR